MIPNNVLLASTEEIVPIVLVSIGITWVITGSKIFYLGRFVICYLLHLLRLRWFWSLVTCPPCNAWWTGGAVALLSGLPLWQVLQLAFTTCGVVVVLQTYFGGDGLAAAEDFADLFGVKEDEHGD